MQATEPYVILTIIGPDGSGKSTLARALASVAQAYPRDVLVMGHAATVLDVRGPTQLFQVVDFADDAAEQALLGTSRARGAILVVSALDSVTSRTNQSLSFARESGIPVVAVAITRCDQVDDGEMLDLITLEVRELLTKHHFAGEELPVVTTGTKSGVSRDDGRGSLTDGPRRLLDAVLR